MGRNKMGRKKFTLICQTVLEYHYI